MYIAFGRGFQNGAFQVAFRKQKKVQQATGGRKHGNSYERSKAEYENKERIRLESEQRLAAENLRAQQYKIDALEQKRLRHLNDQFLQAQLLEMMIEFKRLEAIEAEIQDRLAFFLRDEDDMMAILLSLPFVG